MKSGPCFPFAVLTPPWSSAGVSGMQTTHSQSSSSMEWCCSAALLTLPCYSQPKQQWIPNSPNVFIQIWCKELSRGNHFASFYHDFYLSSKIIGLHLWSHLVVFFSPVCLCANTLVPQNIYQRREIGFATNELDKRGIVLLWHLKNSYRDNKLLNQMLGTIQKQSSNTDLFFFAFQANVY